jgi:hypothetical protein
MMKNDLTSLSEFIDKEIGKRGTKKRDKFESGYKVFKLSVLVQQEKILSTNKGVFYYYLCLCVILQL